LSLKLITPPHTSLLKEKKALTLQNTLDYYGQYFNEADNKDYRLWRRFPITPGNPIIILVHGAVVPLPDAMHRIDQPNNDKYCFYQLDFFLYSDLRYNVFNFEYADTPILDFGYVNYGHLKGYSELLMKAIEVAKDRSQTQEGNIGTVNIIAHSMGGLVARCTAQKMQETINKIITLDTGHLGFELAEKIDKEFVDSLSESMSLPTHCVDDVKPDSEFIKRLIAEFTPGNPDLVSLAASEAIPTSSIAPGIPRIPITVVGLESSSMGQVDNYGAFTPIDYDMPFYRLPYSHVSIAQITDRNHLAYQKIRESLTQNFVDKYSQTADLYNIIGDVYDDD